MRICASERLLATLASALTTSAHIDSSRKVPALKSEQRTLSASAEA